MKNRQIIFVAAAIIITAAGLLCGCNQKPDPQITRRLADDEARITDLEARLAAFNTNGTPCSDWVITNLGNLLTRAAVEKAMDEARWQKDHAGDTNLNPATGLPWLPGEK